MTKNKRYAIAGLGSVCAATILSGAALAGNPHGTPPGQAKGQASTSVSASAGAGNSVGVKSSATTHFGVHAAVGSSATKAYGNGKTAGQVAMQNGAGASTDLYGPGNSQPHKASLCAGGKTHLVDVHALKAHGGASSCVAGSSGAAGSVGAAGSSNLSNSTSANASAHANGQSHSSKGTFTPPSTTKTAGGQATSSVSGRAKPAHPVLGTANFTG
jgi:hypothetical protein